MPLGASVRRDENNRFDDATTWRAQAGYRLPTGTRVRGAYGTGVKNPGYFELYGYSDGRYIGNPNLKPEKSKGWEAGVDQAFAGGRPRSALTYFDSRLEDEIFTFPAFPSHAGEPHDRSKQHGVEAFVSARPVRAAPLRPGLYLLHARRRTACSRDTAAAGISAASTSTALSSDERFSGTLTVRYNGRQDDNAFTDPSFVPVRVALQEYVLVNLNAEYRVTPAIALFGRVENLFDETYEEVFSYAAAGRGAYGGVRARF